DRKSRTLSGSVRLPRGKNEITVQLSNRWHSATFGPIVVEYRRPPQVDPWEARVLDGRPFAQLSAQVASVTALTRAELEVLDPSGKAPAARTFVARREQRWATG